MRIAHIISTYPPYQGGMGNVAFEMVEELAQKGHQIKVLTPRYNQRENVENDKAIRIKPFFKYGNAAYVPKMYSYLEGFDVLHLHYPFFGGAELVASFKKRNPGIPLVISYHMDVVGQGVFKRFFKFYNKRIFPRIIKRADKILVSSLDYANHSAILDTSRFNNIMIEVRCRNVIHRF